MSFSQKIKKRLFWIIAHGLHQFLPPFGQFLISYFVIYCQSAEVWGEVVTYLIVVNLATMLFLWGQNTYLLRAISRAPMKVGELWQRALITRSLILALILVFVVVYYQDDGILLTYLSLWLINTFFYRSFDPIHLSCRSFSVPILIEIVGMLVVGGFFYYNLEAITAIFIVKLYAMLSFVKALGYSFYYRKLLFSEQHWAFDKQFFRAAFPFFIPAFIGFVQSRMDLYGVAYYLPKRTLGEYQIFFKILLLFFLGSRVLLSPFLKSMYRMPLESLDKMNLQLFLVGLFFSAPLILIMYYLLPYFYGIHFSGWLYVAAYLMVVPFFGYVVKTHQLIRCEQESKMAWAFFWAACCNLCLNYWLIPNYGALGAIVSTAMVQWLLLAMFSYLLYKE